MGLIIFSDSKTLHYHENFNHINENSLRTWMIINYAKAFEIYVPSYILCDFK